MRYYIARISFLKVVYVLLHLLFYILPEKYYCARFGTYRQNEHYTDII
jgi:hypothetical protein